MTPNEGKIYRYLPYDEWFVAGSSPHYPGIEVAHCFAGKRVGHVFGLYDSEEPVPDEEVPDEIWAALAKWRLSQ